MMNKDRPQMQHPEKVHQDRLDADALAAAVDALVADLIAMSHNNPARHIRRLTATELRICAVNVIGAYITRRSQQRTLAELDDLLTDDTQSILQ